MLPFGMLKWIDPDTQQVPSTQHPMPNTEPKRGILFGIASGFVAITCCVSPVVLVLLGIATAAEAVTLGDHAVLRIRVVIPHCRVDRGGDCRRPLPARQEPVQHSRRVQVPLDACHPRGIGSGHLRRAVLAHQVPRHLVRLTPPRPRPASHELFQGTLERILLTKEHAGTRSP